MLEIFTKGISQLNDRRTRKVVWISILAAIFVLAALWTGIGYLLTQTTFFSIWWLEWVIDFLGGLATLILTWFLFPAVISAVIGFYLDDIADAVEARHYPDLAPTAGLPFSATAAVTARFLAVMIFLNLALLVFLLLGPLFPFVFYAANGYLLGREYFELVALRRVDVQTMRSMRRANRGQLLIVGVVVMVLLTIPLVNLLAPVVATAAMVHLFEGFKNKPAI